MRTKRAFVPTALGPLEDRAVPAPTFVNGVAALSTQVYSTAVRNIATSYAIFSRNLVIAPIGFNLNAANLNQHLLKSVYPIPYNVRSGLDANLLAITAGLQANLAANPANAAALIANAQNASIAALNNSIVALVRTGNVVII
jgi:hypothetical protein